MNRNQEGTDTKTSESNTNTVNWIDSIDKAPPDLVCPITFEVMVDPVVAGDGYTYERAAIQRFLEGVDKPRSPVTGEDLPYDILIPNLIAQRACREWTERQQQIQQDEGKGEE